MYAVKQNVYLFQMTGKKGKQNKGPNDETEGVLGCDFCIQVQTLPQSSEPVTITKRQLHLSIWQPCLHQCLFQNLLLSGIPSKCSLTACWSSASIHNYPTIYSRLTHKCLPNPFSSLHSHPNWPSTDCLLPHPLYWKLQLLNWFPLLQFTLFLVHSLQCTHVFLKQSSDHTTCQLPNLQWFPNVQNKFKLCGEAHQVSRALLFPPALSHTAKVRVTPGFDCLRTHTMHFPASAPRPVSSSSEKATSCPPSLHHTPCKSQPPPGSNTPPQKTASACSQRTVHFCSL